MADDKEEDLKIIEEAKKRFTICEDFEKQTRFYFDYDYKFANGDAHNLYQWDNKIASDRMADSRPVLTVNKTAQHNLIIINDAKQNKPGVNIRPVGDEATFDSAQIFQGVIRHIEYISNAESVYDKATEFQVQGGFAYWRVNTDYEYGKSFSSEIYIRPIKDPRMVYLDPDIQEDDGSDARFGFIFNDMPRDLFVEKYPKFKDIGWTNNFAQRPDSWATRELVRVAEYYRKTQKDDELVYFQIPEELQPLFDGRIEVTELKSKLSKEEKELFAEIKRREGNLPIEDRTYRERPYLTDDIQWFKIAGNTIIERGPWLGRYVPIVRVIGTETIIDGEVDRKGHTRALINPQQIYNYNTSAEVEFGALQSKSPYLAPMAAIEGFEEFYRTANSQNHSYLPYNHIDDEGNPIPPPTRPQPPQPSMLYLDGMKVAQNEMMMASGQYQAQVGENENAKSGIAINARQRQGDRATYHFIDNQAKAIRFTGKILIDLIPKIYDTKRVKRIMAMDGSKIDVTIDPEAPYAMRELKPGDEGYQDITEDNEKIRQVIFNPNVGTYDVVSDTGPSYATRRQEAFNALIQIARDNKEFMGIAGDILWQVADFPEAQTLAQRWRKIIPPNISGDGPDPQVEQMMHAAANEIETLKAKVLELAKQVQDKENEIKIKAIAEDTRRGEAIARVSREDYDAETRRLTAVGNSGPALSQEQVEPLIRQIVQQMLNTGEPGPHDDKQPPAISEGGTPIGGEEAPETIEAEAAQAAE